MMFICVDRGQSCGFYVQSLMPRSHSGEGATMISVNIEEQRRFQIRQNSPKKRESVVT